MLFVAVRVRRASSEFNWADCYHTTLVCRMELLKLFDKTKSWLYEKNKPWKKGFQHVCHMWASCRCGHQDVHMRKPYLRVHDWWIMVTNWLWKTCFSTFDNTLCIYICWFQWFSKVKSHSMTYSNQHFCGSIITSYVVQPSVPDVFGVIETFWSSIKFQIKLMKCIKWKNHSKPSRTNVINSVLIYENDRTALCSAPLCTHCTLSVHKAF